MSETRKREIRIKRGNTDWWINEKAVVAANGKTYITYCTDTGEIHVKELDAKCSRALSSDVCICRLNCCYCDEHNAASICVLESGHIMVAYTGHGSSNELKYRVTERPYDILSFGPEKRLGYNGTVTYAQLFENTHRGELWLFTRVNGVTWEFRTTSDVGESWSDSVTFLASDQGGLFYFDVRKLFIPTATSYTEQWFFALYGHPTHSKDHTIRAGLIDCDGNLLDMDGKMQGVCLFEENHRFDIESLMPVYSSPEGTTVRLLDVSPTPPYRIGFSPFVYTTPETLHYRVASYHNGGWLISEPICDGGEFLALATQRDGSETYVGGMAFYYGTGHFMQWGAGRHYVDTDRVYIARYDGRSRVLESYITNDRGAHYELFEGIRSIAGKGDESDVKIWRPIVPIHAQDNMPVYWHEGYYSAHTGGWHCDTVMDVEYDD